MMHLLVTHFADLIFMLQALATLPSSSWPTQNPVHARPALWLVRLVGRNFSSQCCGKVHNWFIIFILFALPLPAISLASLSSETLLTGAGSSTPLQMFATTSVGAFCPTLFLSAARGTWFSLKSSSSAWLHSFCHRWSVSRLSGSTQLDLTRRFVAFFAS